MARHASREAHAILGVGLRASRAEVSRAFRTRARELHPDVSGADTTAQMAELAAARDALLEQGTEDSAPTPGTEPRERPAWAAAHEPAWTDHWAAWNEPRRPDRA